MKTITFFGQYKYHWQEFYTKESDFFGIVVIIHRLKAILGLLITGGGR